MTSRWHDLARPPLSESALRRALVDGPGPWTSVKVVPHTGSTNADLVARAVAGAAQHGTVLTTDDQRAGRGRRDRSWTTPARTAIAVSVLVMPPVPRARWSWLPLLAGVGVLDAVLTVCGLDARLKWPNDVLVGQSKLCGILVEVAQTPSGPVAIVGVGLNVSQQADELAAASATRPATSLALAGSATTDRDTVLRAVLRGLGGRYEAWAAADGDPRKGGISAAYRERCATIGAQVRVQLPATMLEGEAEGVDDEGRLLVRAADGRLHALAAGDVVHVRPN